MNKIINIKNKIIKLLLLAYRILDCIEINNISFLNY